MYDTHVIVNIKVNKISYCVSQQKWTSLVFAFV